MIVSSRRGFIAGALALVAAPAVVRAASLMPVAPIERWAGARRWIGRSELDVLYGSKQLAPGSLLTVPQITREAVRLFNNSNVFLRDLDRQYDEAFAASDAKMGDVLRIRLPNSLSVQAITDRELYRADYDFVKGEQWEKPVSALAFAVAAPVVVAKALEVPVTRRFWSK